MAKGKESALIRANWISIFEELDDAEAGQLIKHYMRFINGLNPEPPNRIIKLVFEPIKIQLEKDLVAWKATCDKNKLNGEKGGRPPLKKPTGLFGLNEKPKKPDNDIDIDNEYEKDDDKGKGKGKKIISIQKKEEAIAKAIERKKNFYDSLVPYLAKYDKSMIKEFYDYWSEFNPSQTKMLWEFKPTFEIAKRLATWDKNNKPNKNSYKSEGDKRRENSAKLGEMAASVIQNTKIDFSKIEKRDG